MGRSDSNNVGDAQFVPHPPSGPPPARGPRSPEGAASNALDATPSASNDTQLPPLLPCPAIPGAVSPAAEQPPAEEKKEGDEFEAMMSSVTEECCVCLEVPKNTVLMPCRHLCVCNECSQILTQCPLCRFEVVHRLEVCL